MLTEFFRDQIGLELSEYAVAAALVATVMALVTRRNIGAKIEVLASSMI